MTRLLVAIPLVLFLALAGVFAFRVTDGADRSVVPSALIGKPAPAGALPALDARLPGFDPAALRGEVTLVNVWASWCAPCRVEHPLLMQLAETPGLRIVGLNYKDRMPAATAFLAELGNPYDAVGVDADGRRGIEWGVYGVPETFLVGPEGTILAKHVGPLTEDALAGSFGATMRALLAEHAPRRMTPEFVRRVPDGDTLERAVCGRCGFVAYENPKIVVGAVVRRGRQILMCRRDIEPSRGLWTLPAGYLEHGETPEEGARREAWEEATAAVVIERLLAVYTIRRLGQVQLLYRGRLASPSFAPGVESQAVALFDEDRLPWETMAFPSVGWALRHEREVGGPFGNPEESPTADGKAM